MNAQMIYDRCATKLLRAYPFWGSLLLGLEVQQSTDIPAMATDGVTIWYNPDYLTNEREAIICSAEAHEAGHRMFRDSLRRGNRDPGLWNMACDYRINLYLQDAGLEIADNWLIDQQYRGMDAELIYDHLVSTGRQQGFRRDGPNCGCGGLKDHPSLQGQSKDKADSDGDQPTENGLGSIPDVNFGEAEVLMDIAQAKAFAKGQGKMPGDLEEVISEILNPKIRWDQVLQRFMENCSQDDFSWMVPDRRFLSYNMYLPGIESEGVDTFVIAVDTSYSTIKHVPAFLGNISTIAKVLKFTNLIVIYCDTKVQHVDEYTRADLPIRPGRTFGGGGTDFRPVFGWLEERGISPKGMVFLTDTQGPFPTVPPQYPVLWAVPNDNAKVPFGDIVKMD